MEDYGAGNLIRAFQAGAGVWEGGQRLRLARQQQALAQEQEEARQLIAARKLEMDEQAATNLETERLFQRGLKEKEDLRKAAELSDYVEHNRQVEADFATFRDAFISERLFKDPDTQISGDEMIGIERKARSRALEKNITRLPFSMASRAQTGFEQIQSREELAREKAAQRKDEFERSDLTKRYVADQRNATELAKAEKRWGEKSRGMSKEQYEEFRAKRAVIEKAPDLSFEQKIEAIDTVMDEVMGRIPVSGGGGTSEFGNLSKTKQDRIAAIDTALEQLEVLEAGGATEVDTKTKDNVTTINPDTWDVYGEDPKEVRRNLLRERRALTGEKAPTGDDKKDKEAGWEKTQSGKPYRMAP